MGQMKSFVFKTTTSKRQYGNNTVKVVSWILQKLDPGE